jgi:hypothetical protein
VKRHISCTTPTGQVLTRHTARNYTHVVALLAHDGSDARALAWCGTYRLAETQARYWHNNLRHRFTEEYIKAVDIRILPVDPERRAPGRKASAEERGAA